MRASSPRLQQRFAALVVTVLFFGVGIQVGDVFAGAAYEEGAGRTILAERSRVSKGYSLPTLVGKIADQDVAESSGLAVSRKNPGVLWTHNDSGDSPRLFCVEVDGTSCGTFDVTGASNVDWESMALLERPGNDSLLVADIGDNSSVRPSITIYQIDEPDMLTAGKTAAAPVVSTHELIYPDGPKDAESLVVDPSSGDIFIIEKTARGKAGVYRAALESSGVQTLDHVTQVKVRSVAFGATAADVSPDGNRLVIATYFGAIERTIEPGAPFSDLFEAPGRRVSLGMRIQGESIAYSADGLSIYAGSEGGSSPIYQVSR